MPKIASSCAVPLPLLVLLAVAPAHALNDRSWVASTGNDMNECTRTKPCATLQRAVNNTALGGIVGCVNNSNYNSGVSPQLLITKSITIDCTGTVDHLRTENGGIAVRIDAPAATVKLRGLMLDGAGSGAIGIDFVNGSALHVHDCRIANFRDGLGGIRFAPPAGVAARLHVGDTVINENGASTTGAGILIQPSGSGSAQVAVSRVRIENNTYGIVATASSASGGITLHARDTVVTNNTFNGVSANGSGPRTWVMLDRSASTLSGIAGISAEGASAKVVLSQSTAMSNATGLRVGGGGLIESYENNQITGNSVDGAPTGVLTRR
jgi:hypothetical protein